MAIFGSASARLLREDWPTTTMLAQELYAIFNSDGPIEITSPVMIVGETPVPPLQVTNAYADAATGSKAVAAQFIGSSVVQGSSYVGGQQLVFTPNGTTSSKPGGTEFVADINPTYTLDNGVLTVTNASTPGTPISQVSLNVGQSNTLTSQTQLGTSGVGATWVGTVQDWPSTWGTRPDYTFCVQLLGDVSPGGTKVRVLFPMLNSAEVLVTDTPVVPIVGVQSATNADGTPSYTYYGNVSVWMA